MRTIVVGASWITKYFIADILYNDGNFEDYIQVISTEPIEDFFISFPKLQEFQGDERLSYIQVTRIDDVIDKGIELEHVDSIYFDCLGYYPENLFNYLGAQKFTGRIVLASSWEVYGWRGRSKVPIDTREELTPETEYGKILAEQESLLKATKLNYVILRFGTVFGPYMPSDHELVKMTLQAMYGQDIVVDGVPSRWVDLVYITDILPVIYKSLSMGGIDRQIFNVGGFHDFTTPEQPKKNLLLNEKRITDIVRSMRHLMGSESPITFAPNVKIPQGKGFHSQLDIKSTQETFNYYPNFDSIKLSQLIWWVESLANREQKRTKDIEVLYPSLNKSWEGDIQKLGEEMNISQEQFEEQLTEASKLAKKDAKIKDVT